MKESNSQSSHDIKFISFLSQVQELLTWRESTNNKEPGWRRNLRNILRIFQFIISCYICIYYCFLIILFWNFFPTDILYFHSSFSVKPNWKTKTDSTDANIIIKTNDH